MELLSGMVLKILPWRCVSFLIGADPRLLSKLDDQIRRLSSMHVALRERIDIATTNEGDVADEVYIWLVEATHLVEEGEKFLKLCIGGTLPRSEISAEAENIMMKIDFLLENGKFDGNIYRQPVIFDSEQNILEGLESRMSICRRIIEELRDRDVGLIGVHGMGGVGKTTLVKEVVRYAVEEGLFDVTVWPEVPAEASYVRRIQDEIAEGLGLGLDHEESEAMRADIISQVLTRSERKVLIILDDVWQRLDLWKIGIREEYGFYALVPFKVLLTSRSIKALRSISHEMKILSVPTLTAEEAFCLFQKHVEQAKSAEFSALAQGIAKCCGGLPLTIFEVAGQLSGCSLSGWQDALQILSSSVINSVLGKRTFSCLNRSYDHLRNKEEEFIFLLCSVLGEQIDCEDLLKYALGLGLFQAQGLDTVSAVKDKLYHLINSLRESCFLEDGKNSQYVTMNDLVRDFALHAVSRVDGDCFIVRKHSWQTLPWEEMAKFGYISLQISNIMHELPQRLLFPNPKLLHIYDENRSSKIPDDFFIGTEAGLRVLALIKMQLLSLPSSLLVLTNMDTLCLDYCELGDISMIGELQTLRVLSLSHTNIEQLPKQIGQLTRLCLLDLSNCSNLNVIPPDVLSSLTQLEDLRMENSFNNWVVGEDNDKSNASLVELTRLKFLSALNIHIPDTKIIPEAFSWDHLDRYEITIGQDFPCSREREAFKVLKLNYKKGNIEGSEHWIKLLLKSSEQVWLKEFKGFENFLLDLNKGRWESLKHLHIQDDDELEYLTPKVVTEILESLVLKKLSNLRGIKHREFFDDPLGNLTVVKIECCPRLEFVFDVKRFARLIHVRELEVTGCKKMVAIAQMSGMQLINGKPFFDGVPWEFEFPHLHALTLQDLDNLSGFWRFQQFDDREIISTNSLAGLPRLRHLKLIRICRIRHLVLSTTEDRVLPLQNLKTMEIVECDGLHDLFIIEGHDIDENHDRLLPDLRQLYLRNLGSLERIVGDNRLWRMLNFKMLNQLTVCGCDKLKYLLPLYILKNLEQLQNIDISNCELLVRVFGNDEDTVITDQPNKMALSLLRFLRLSNLPRLVSICSGASHIIPLHLKQMTIEDCPKLTFPFEHSLRHTEEDPPVENFREMITVLSWENMNLHKLNCLKNMCIDFPASFTHLISLQLYQCDNLKYLFSSSVTQRLSSLQELKIISCERVEQIILEETRETSTLDTIEFSQVNTLILEKLPKFTRFCEDGCVVKWLSLKMVRVVECPKIRKSSLGTVDGPLLKSVQVIDCKPWENKDLNSNIIHLFKLTDELSDLPELKIEGSEHIKKYVELELQESSFTQLKMLEARQCDEELNKFLSILLRRSYKVERLTVENCKQLEQVFDLGDFVADKNGHGLFPILHSMRLFDLPKLNCIWNKDPRGIIELGKLVKLEIIKCGLRKSIVSTAILESLVQLEELNIDSCEMIEEVVEEETEKQERSFPNLKGLKLVRLPKFIKFNSGNCNFRFPNMLTLTIENCPNMNVFTTGILSTQTTTIEGTSDQMLDEIMDMCPKVQKLKLVGLDTFDEIWQGCVSTKSACELNELEVDALCNLKYIFPSSMVPRLKKLTKLIVSNCNSLSIVFQRTEEKDLKLPVLGEPIPSCPPALKQVLQNLEIVRVKSCDSLQHLSLGSSCVRLKEIEISNCKILEEIFIDTEEEKTNERIFYQLKSIILENLPKLSSFTAETFKFPSLMKVKIVDCPALETFSRNVSATADNYFSNMDSFEELEEMHLINVGGRQNIWNSDPSSSSQRKLKIVPSNTLIMMQKLKKFTVQNFNALEVLFDIDEDSLSGEGEMKLLPQLEVLELSDLPDMQLWKQEPKNPVLKNLTSLEIISCRSIKKLFSISVAKHLSVLKLLKLYECENMVQVLQGGEENSRKGNSEKVFQKLEHLILKHLPNLTSFCEENLEFEFSELQMVRVEDIPKMKTFVMGSLKTPKLKEVYATYIAKCWQGDLNKTITYLCENQGKLKRMNDFGRLRNCTASWPQEIVQKNKENKGKQTILHSMEEHSDES